MASPLHDGLLRVLRDRPSLLAELLGDAFPLSLAAAADLRVVDTQLDEVPVREHRADLVLAVGGDAPSLVLVVEAQRRVLPDKPRAWLSYLHGALLRYRAPARLVVLATSPSVAAWAEGPFDFEGSSVVLRPSVLSKENVPLVSPQVAARSPEHAMLALLFHRRDPRVLPAIEAALSTIARLDTSRAADYSEVAWQTLAVHLRPAWEALMRASSRKLVPPFVQEWEEKGRLRGLEEGLEKGLEKGLEEGLEKGLEKGLEEGRLEGRVEGLEEGREWGRAATLLAVLEQRGLPLSDTQRRRILGCRDGSTLDEWTRRVLVVESVAALLGPARARRRSPSK